MFDLYLLITPLFALLSFFALLNLKLTLAEPKLADLSKQQLRSSSQQKNEKQKDIAPQDNSEKTFQSQYLKTLNYVLKNFTIADLCLVRRSRNKIPLMLSMSLQAFLALQINTWYIYFSSFLGFVIALSYLFLKIVFQAQKNHANDKFSQREVQLVRIPQKYGQKIEIILTFFTLLINLAVIWLIYHNTKNSQILKSVCNFLILISLDNFTLKPLLLTLFAFPLNSWSLSRQFIDKDIELSQILQREKTFVNKKASNKVAKKLHNSTSHTQNTFEIEPCVNFDIHSNNVQNYNSVNWKELSNENFNRKKPKDKYQQSQSSLIKYVNYPFKNIEPNSVGAKVCNLRKIELENNMNNQSSISNKEAIQNKSITRRRNKLYSEKVRHLPQFNCDDSKCPIRIEGQELINHISHKITGNQKDYLSAKKSITSRQNEITQKTKQFQILHTYSKGIAHEHVHQKESSILTVQKVNHSCLSNFPQNKGLPEILGDKRQTLQQIDMNSPQRRNKSTKISIKAIQQRKMSNNQNDVEQKFGNRQVYRKFSLDPSYHNLQKHQTAKNLINQENNNEEIKFQSQNNKIQNGDNRVQNEQNKIVIDEKINWRQFSNRRKTVNRSSEMDLSRKSDVFKAFSNDSRFSKSIKRTKNTKDPIVRQNDQNQIPEFIIQDFAY